LKEIDVSGFDISNAEFTYLFSSCKKLKKLDLSSFVCSKNHRSRRTLALEDCESLELIYTPVNYYYSTWIQYLPGNDGYNKVNYFYDVQGNSYQKMPKEVGHSIVLKKGEVPNEGPYVSFDPRGGRMYDFYTGEISKSAMNIPIDYKGNVKKIPICDKAGVAFSGWYTDPDGGVKIDGSYIFTGEETCYAHYRKLYGGSPTFNIETDMFGFKDFKGSAVNNARWDYMYSDLLRLSPNTSVLERKMIEIKEIDNAICKIEGIDSGWCYGLCVLMALINKGYYSPTYFGAKNVFDIEHTTELNRWATYYFMTQDLVDYDCAASKSDENRASRNLVEKLKNGEGPIIVSCDISETSDYISGKGSHSVLAYGLDDDPRLPYYIVYCADTSAGRMGYYVDGQIPVYLDESSFPDLMYISKSDYSFMRAKHQNGRFDTYSTFTNITGIKYNLYDYLLVGTPLHKVSKVYSTTEKIFVTDKKKSTDVKLSVPFYTSRGDWTVEEEIGKYYVEDDTDSFDFQIDSEKQEFLAVEYEIDGTNIAAGAQTDADTISITEEGCVSVEGASESVEVFTTLECGNNSQAIVRVRTDNADVEITPSEEGVDVLSSETLGTIYVSVDDGNEKTININGSEATSLVPEFNITLDVNGGEQLDKKDFKLDIYSSVGRLPVPIKEGYTFDGWYTLKEGGDNIADIGHVYDDMTLYAHWKTCCVDSVSLNLSDSGSVGLNFYLQLGEDIAKNGCVKVMNGRSNTITSYDTIEKEMDGTYKICHMLNAKEMNDSLIVTIYDSSGKKINLNNESAIDGSLSYSIKRFCEDADADENADVKINELLSAMYDYGLLSQIYSDYYASEIQNSPQIQDADLSQYKMTWIKNMPAGIDYEGSSLLLKSKTEVRHYFTCSGNINDYVFMVDDQIVEIKNKNNVYYIEITGIPAAKLADFNKITVTNKSTGAVGEFNYSAMSYCNKVFTSVNDSKLRDLVMGLYEYHKAAKEYF